MTASKHAYLHLAAIEEDRPRLIMDTLVGGDTALHHHPEGAHHQGGMEVVQPREIVIWTLIGRVLFPVRDHRERAHGPILPDRGPGLPHVEAETMDVETARRHQEEGGEGVLATPAFPATAIGAVAGVEVDMDAEGVSVPISIPMTKSSMVAIETDFRRTTGNIRDPDIDLWRVFSMKLYPATIKNYACQNCICGWKMHFK